MSWAKVERVIGVYTISDGGKTARVRQFVQRGKKLVLAEIATIGGVCAVGGIVHFVRFDEFVAQAQLGHELFHDGTIVSRVTRRERGNGQGARAQRFVGGPGQIGGVRATRERDDERRNPPETSHQEIFLFFRKHHGALHVANMNKLFHLTAAYL